MKNRVLICLFMALFMVVMAPTTLTFAEGEPVEFAGGTGTATDPYQIENQSQLKQIGNYGNACFILNNDIVLEPGGIEVDPYGMDEPTGDETWKPFNFSGTLDGNGKTISNFVCLTNYQYFINKNTGTIKNLRLSIDNGEIMVHENSGNITGCLVTGTKKGNYAGIAYYNSGTIDSCINGVNNEDGYVFTSGICDYNRNAGVIKNCLNYGNMTVTRSSAGGGGCSAICYSNQGTIQGCLNIGSLSNILSGNNVYGVADSNSGQIDNTYYIKKHIAGSVRSNSGTDNSVMLAVDDISNESMLPGFDFENDWIINANNVPVPRRNPFVVSNEGLDLVLAPVNNISVKSFTYQSIKVSWESNGVADKYNIYRGGNSNKGTLVGTVDGSTNTFIDSGVKQGTAYYYYVVPVYVLFGDEVEGYAYGCACGYAVDTTSSKTRSAVPIIDDVKVLTKDVKKPGVINVEVTARDIDTGIDSITVSLDGGLSGTKKFNTTKQTTVIVEIPVSASAASGQYRLSSVSASDSDGLSSGTKGSIWLDATTINVSDEFDVEFTGSLSNNNVPTELSNMEEGKTVVLLIDEESDGILKKECLDAIAGKDKTIVVYCDSAGSQQWVFYGKNIVGETKDLQLATVVSAVDGSLYGGSGKIAKIEFADNGDLPGIVNFRLKSTYVKNQYSLDSNMILYYLSNGIVSEEEAECTVIRDGSEYWCYIDLSHNSTYFLSGKALNNDISNKTIKLSATNYTYDGKAKNPTVTVKNGDVSLKADKDYTIAYESGRIKAGNYKVTIKGLGNYSGSTSKSFTINKAANSLSVKAKTATVKYSKVKKKAQTLAVGKVIKFTKKGQGTMSYTISSVKKGSKSFKGKITINKKTGKVTVKKGLKKGTYKVKVKVKAGGNTNYKASAVKIVTFTIKVK